MEFPGLNPWPAVMFVLLVTFMLGAVCGKVGCPVRVEIHRAEPKP